MTSSSVDKPTESSRERAARLLTSAGALADLGLDEALAVVSRMRARRLPAGKVMFREGDADHSDHLLLVLEGEVTVEGGNLPGHDSLVMNVAGPGALLGEMGFLDGGPRSATCTAATDVAVAVLDREALKELMKDQPQVAANLLLAVSRNLSEHLRETNRKLMAFARVGRVLQQELDAVHAVNQRLLGAAPAPAAPSEHPDQPDRRPEKAQARPR